MSNCKQLIKKIISHIPLPTKRIILFESYPDCSGNTKAVFDELIRRGCNSKYKMIWMLQTSNPENHEKRYNVKYLKRGLSLYLSFCFAKLFICENSFFSKTHKHGQYIMYLTHGAPLKNDTWYYKVPDDVDEMVDLSPFFQKYDVLSLNDRNRNIVLNPLGFPRNDVLLGERRNPHELFKDRNFNRLIYWLPTFRQHKNVGLEHSSVSIPIIHDEENALAINQKALESNVLIAVKPHPVQDLSKIKALNLSNILFIENDYLIEKGFTNYELLGCSDALLTDYSSVYYDFLMTDRPIGLCWEDFEDYNSREGFVVDINQVMAGGEKLYSVEDLCGFIDRIGSGIDLLQERRADVRRMVFPNGIHFSTSQTADRIEEILNNL